MSLQPLAITLCLGTLGYDVSSARADSTEDSAPRRELGGHRFFPSLIVGDPFLSTYLAVFTASGYEWIDGPSFDSQGSFVSSVLTNRSSYRAQAIAEGLTFQANVTDYLAIRVAGGGGIDAGSNARSAVVVGAIQPITAGAGATLGWNLRHDARIGFTFDAVYSHIKDIQPLVAIRESLVAGDVVASSASEKLDGYSLLPGVAFAFAPSPSVGLLASAQYSWTSLFDDTTRNFQSLSVGASAQLDFLPPYAVPVGVMASYRATIPFDSDVRFTNTVEVGVFYTGRKDLDLGLDVQGKWFDLRPDHVIRLDTTELIGAIEIRYHWN